MKKFLLLLFYLPVVCSSINAQGNWNCGTPSFQAMPKNHNTWKDPISIESSTDTFYIPVVVHILGKDDGSGYIPVSKVLEALCRLQTDMDEHRFRFYLDSLHYINSSTFYNMSAAYYGSDSMYQFITGHNIPNALNLYIVENAQGSAFLSVLPPDYDFSTYPLTINNGHKHGIVMPKVWTGLSDHTITHEVGHYLGLMHTFNGWETINYLNYAGAPAPDSITRSGEIAGIQYTITVPVERTDSSNCNYAGDFICDTPPDYLSIGFTCNTGQQSPVIQTDPAGGTFRSDGTNYYVVQ